MHQEQAAHALIPYRLFVGVWGALVLLTAITSVASLYFPGAIGITVAVVVTPLKAALVLAFFMHLKYESAVYRVMLYSTFAIVAVFLVLTYVDYFYR